MPLVLLPSCTRFDVLNVLEHVCALLHSRHSAIFAAPSLQCAHASAMVGTRHMFSVRLAYTSHFHCKWESLNRTVVHSFFFFQFIVDFLLGLHASLTVSSFNDGPKASLGHDPPAIEQIVPVAPIACRDSGDDLCCLRFLKTLTK